MTLDEALAACGACTRSLEAATSSAAWLHEALRHAPRVQVERTIVGSLHLPGAYASAAWGGFVQLDAIATQLRVGATSLHVDRSWGGSAPMHERTRSLLGARALGRPPASNVVTSAQLQAVAPETWLGPSAKALPLELIGYVQREPIDARPVLEPLLLEGAIAIIPTPGFARDHLTVAFRGEDDLVHVLTSNTVDRTHLAPLESDDPDVVTFARLHQALVVPRGLAMDLPRHLAALHFERLLASRDPADPRFVMVHPSLQRAR